MPEVNFKSLQNLHESLLQKQQKLSEEHQQDFTDFTKEVREYIEQAKRAGSHIASTRERDQVRANLRYWANYMYSIEKTFPDTELAPSTVTEKRPIGTIITVMVFFLLILFSAIQTFRSTFNQSTETPTDNPTSVVTQTPAFLTSEATATAPVEESSTPESGGYNVILDSPANLENITPNVEFSGFYENLKPGWAIHVLFIKGDKFFPTKDDYLIPEKPTNNRWTISTQLTESAEELSKPQSYSVVLAVSLDDSSRDLLSNSSEIGIDINSMPATVIRFDNTARVIFREKGFTKFEGTGLVYSLLVRETRYDLYTSGPNQEDVRQITFTSDVSELSPSISPDGTKIVYVHFIQETNTYSIHVMDSNGGNDYEITERTRNLLENPQWSPDGMHISYAMGITSQSSNRASWIIHTYELSTGSDEEIFKEPESLVQSYHIWLPDMNSIIFEARSQLSGTIGFDIISIDSSEEQSHCFDTKEDDSQPSIKSLENGYLLTYTIVRADKKHDIYAAVIDSCQQIPFDGFQIRLTNTGAGDIVRGVEVTSTNYPIPDPNSNSIYYIRSADIYRLLYEIEGDRIKLIPGIKNDSDYFGDLIVETSLGQDISGFDVGFIDTFFEIK